MKGQVGLIRLPPIKPFGLVKAVEDRRLRQCDATIFYWNKPTGEKAKFT